MLKKGDRVTWSDDHRRRSEGLGLCTDNTSHELTEIGTIINVYLEYVDILLKDGRISRHWRHCNLVKVRRIGRNLPPWF